jgi:hypothetical protein
MNQLIKSQQFAKSEAADETKLAFKPAVCRPSNALACLAKATLPATGPSHLFFRAFKPAICPPSNAPAGLAKATLPATGPSHLFLTAFTPAVCLAFKCFQPFRKPF